MHVDAIVLILLGYAFGMVVGWVTRGRAEHRERQMLNDIITETRDRIREQRERLRY